MPARTEKPKPQPPLSLQQRIIDALKAEGLTVIECRRVRAVEGDIFALNVKG